MQAAGRVQSLQCFMSPPVSHHPAASHLLNLRWRPDVKEDPAILLQLASSLCADALHSTLTNLHRRAMVSTAYTCSRQVSIGRSTSSAHPVKHGSGSRKSHRIFPALLSCHKFERGVSLRRARAGASCICNPRSGVSAAPATSHTRRCKGDP